MFLSGQHETDFVPLNESNREAQSVAENGEGQTKELPSEQIQDLQQQLQVSDDHVREKDVVLAAKQQEIEQLMQEHQQAIREKDRNIEAMERQLRELTQQLAASKQVAAQSQQPPTQQEKELQEQNQKQQIEPTQEHEQAIREKDRNIEAMERQLQELTQQLAASKQVTAQSQQPPTQQEKVIKELQEQNQYLQQALDNVSQQKEKLTLSWKTWAEAPAKMERGSATGCGNMAYFKPTLSSQVHSYNSDTEEWSVFPELPTESFTITVVNGLVTAVGGKKYGNCTNTLLSLVGGDKKKRKWVEHFPPMPTKRKLTAAVCTGKALVVAGGEEGSFTTVWSTRVEVMNTKSLKWSKASRLPHPLSDASASACGDSVYIVGGRDQHGSTNSVFACSLSTLLQSETMRTKMKMAGNQQVWHTVTDLPVTRSSCVAVNGQLLAVGGYDNVDDSNTIYSYNTETSSWDVISHMATSRSWCLVTVLPANKLMVVGGWANTGHTDKVEIAKISRV